MNNKYSDIINYTNWEPKHHLRMSLENRASQFTPFAALTGYNNEINEKNKIFDKRRYIEEDIKNDLDKKLLIIKTIINNNPLIELTYFKYDNKKLAGKYVNEKYNIKKIDLVNRTIITVNDKFISIDDIIDIKIFE